MKTLSIITSPNPILKEVSKEVSMIDDDLRKLMDNMLLTMYHEEGIGLAAVQIGVLKRVLVIDINYTDGTKNPLYMVNPIIIYKSDELLDFTEGCLSFPEIRADLKRNKKIKVKYTDYNGQNKELEAIDLLSICIQHEIDHLNGITFLDHLSKLKRHFLLKKMKKITKKNA